MKRPKAPLQPQQHPPGAAGVDLAQHFIRQVEAANLPPAQAAAEILRATNLPQSTEIILALMLSARDQEVLRLVYYEELSHAEIGAMLDCSARNVAVRLHRALKRLKKQMERDTQRVVLDVSS